MVEKKGQAAMEFLMTYGWALLVVLVAIGALAFFGVLNPGQFLPSSCTVAPGIACNDFVANTTGVTVILQNGMGNSLTGVSLTADTATCTGSTTITDGQDQTYICAKTYIVGEKLKADLVLTYKIGNDVGALSHTKTGQLVTQVE